MPLLLLLFLPPLIAELLTASSPPAEFFIPFAFVVLVGLYGGGAILARDGACWRDAHRLAQATGGLFFHILLAPLQEFDRMRPDNTRGMTAVGVAMLLFLVWAALQVKQRARSRATQPGGGTPS